MIHVVRLAPEHLTAYAKLFEASASTCFCRYWHFEGAKNDWLARSAHEPEKSRDENAALVRANDERARGLLALDAGDAVGWMKLAPRRALPKLRRLPVYRALDLGDDEDVWSVGCFLVRPDRRGTGVARALLDAAGEEIRRWGGRAIEAYPRRSTEPMHPEEVWMGPESLFLGAGFQIVGGEGPYPVLRKQIEEVAGMGAIRDKA